MPLPEYFLKASGELREKLAKQMANFIADSTMTESEKKLFMAMVPLDWIDGIENDVVWFLNAVEHVRTEIQLREGMPSPCVQKAMKRTHFNWRNESQDRAERLSEIVKEIESGANDKKHREVLKEMIERKKELLKAAGDVGASGFIDTKLFETIEKRKARVRRNGRQGGYTQDAILKALVMERRVFQNRRRKGAPGYDERYCKYIRMRKRGDWEIHTGMFSKAWPTAWEKLKDA